MPSPTTVAMSSPPSSRRGRQVLQVDRAAEPLRFALALGRASDRRLDAVAQADRRAVERRVVGDLERRPAAGPQHAPHLAHVAERDLRVGDVLEDDVRDDGVDRRVLDRVQRRPVAVMPADVRQVGVELRAPARASRRRRRARGRAARVSASTRVSRPTPQPMSSDDIAGLDAARRRRSSTVVEVVACPAPRSGRRRRRGRSRCCRRSRTRPRARGRPRSAPCPPCPWRAP